MKKFLLKSLLLIPILSANNNNVLASDKKTPFVMNAVISEGNEPNNISEITKEDIENYNIAAMEYNNAFGKKILADDCTREKLESTMTKKMDKNKGSSVCTKQKDSDDELPSPPQRASDIENYFEKLLDKNIICRVSIPRGNGCSDDIMTNGFFDFNKIGKQVEEHLGSLSKEQVISFFYMTDNDRAYLKNFLRQKCDVVAYRALINALLKDIAYSTDCEKGAVIDRMRIWFLCRNLVDDFMQEKHKFTFSLLKFGTVSRYEELINKLGFNQPMVDQTTTAADLFRENLYKFTQEQHSEVFKFLLDNTELLCKDYCKPPTHPACLNVSSCCRALVENGYTLDPSEIKSSLDLLRFLGFDVGGLKKVLELNISHCPLEYLHDTVREKFGVFHNFTKNKNPVDLIVDYLRFVNNMVELFGIKNRNKLVEITIKDAFELYALCNGKSDDLRKILRKKQSDFQPKVKSLLANISQDNYKKFIEILSKETNYIWQNDKTETIESSPLYGIAVELYGKQKKEPLTDTEVETVLNTWEETCGFKKSSDKYYEKPDLEIIDYDGDEYNMDWQEGWSAEENGAKQEG